MTTKLSLRGSLAVLAFVVVLSAAALAAFALRNARDAVKEEHTTVAMVLGGRIQQFFNQEERRATFLAVLGSTLPTEAYCRRLWNASVLPYDPDARDYVLFDRSGKSICSSAGSRPWSDLAPYWVRSALQSDTVVVAGPFHGLGRDAAALSVAVADSAREPMGVLTVFIPLDRVEAIVRDTKVPPGLRLTLVQLPDSIRPEVVGDPIARYESRPTGRPVGRFDVLDEMVIPGTPWHVRVLLANEAHDRAVKALFLPRLYWLLSGTLLVLVLIAALDHRVKQGFTALSAP